MPTRKQLNQRHPSYDGQCAEKLRALYEGGKCFRKHINEFLPARPKEPGEQYKLRCKESVYRNYVGPIVDYFASLLFSSAPIATAARKGSTEAVTDLPDYYAEFHEDCDRAGNDLVSVMKAQLTDAMVVGRSWLWLQQPQETPITDGRALTRAEFETLKLGDSWVKPLKSEEVLDWELDDVGNLEFAIVYDESSKRTSITGGRDQVVETWHVLTPDQVFVYQFVYKTDKPPSEDAEVPLIASYPHRYGMVPLICFELLPALHVVSRLEEPQIGHFQLSAMQKWGMSRTCYAMPVFKRDSEEQSEPTMGSGYGIYLGLKESLEWSAPPVDCYEALADEIMSYKDEIYRISQTMALGVENNSAAVGRSADSKAADARATTVVMQAFAKAVKQLMERLYDLIGTARGDTYIWAIDGLDDFAADDLPNLCAMLEQVEAAGGIPSKTFKVEMGGRLAESFMPDLPPDKKNKIRNELEAGVEDQTVAAKRKREDEQLKAIGKNLKTETPKTPAGPPKPKKPPKA